VNLPSAPVFSPGDYPEVDPRLLESLTRVVRDLYNSLREVPQSGTVADKSFLSVSSGATTVNVANPLDAKPSMVHVNVRREDFAALSAAWSFDWKMEGESIRLSFIGLPASTRMRLSLEAR